MAVVGDVARSLLEEIKRWLQVLPADQSRVGIGSETEKRERTRFSGTWSSAAL